MAMINIGRINLSNDIPEDFIATNSNLSPILPKVIMDDSKMDMGNAYGTSVTLAYKTNLDTVNKSSPFPTRSSTYFQMIWIMKIISETKNEARKGQKNSFRMSLSNFLIKTTIKLI